MSVVRSRRSITTTKRGPYPHGAYGSCEEYRCSPQASCIRPWLRWGHKEVFNPDRKPSQANARRVPNCIRDSAGRARDADFTNALDAKSVHVRVVFLDHERVQAWYVGVHWDVVFGEVHVDDPAGTVVADGLLMKRERYAPDHPAIDLAADHTWIDDATGSECTNKTGGTDLTKIGIDFDLSENGAVRMHGI